MRHMVLCGVLGLDLLDGAQLGDTAMHVEGLDLSLGMLDEARATGSYDKLSQAR